ncbi:MAG: phosphoribosylanthranilate isomerase, partial [Saprospiraceae bacterium]|nr:phosphoribosylanthranilate isomerase [Saprospiraceae bacterium]
GLMRNGPDLPGAFHALFQSEGKMLFKACGIRSPDLLHKLNSSSDTDWLGINFSPASKRRISPEAFAQMQPAQFDRLVAVFYQNDPAEIIELLARFPFKTIQLYAGDVCPAFVRELKTRVILAIKTPPDLSADKILASLVEPYAADVDCFILDGASPGSGTGIKSDLPEHFPYPFLLAGGLNEDNLELAAQYPNCIGVDIASGIETDGEPDFEKIRRIKVRLAALPLPHDLSDRL